MGWLPGNLGDRKVERRRKAEERWFDPPRTPGISVCKVDVKTEKKSVETTVTRLLSWVGLGDLPGHLGRIILSSAGTTISRYLANDEKLSIFLNTFVGARVRVGRLIFAPGALCFYGFSFSFSGDTITPHSLSLSSSQKGKPHFGSIFTYDLPAALGCSRSLK